MSSTNPGPGFAATASGAISLGARVKITAVSGDEYTVAVAGAGERSHGTALRAAADGERLGVEGNLVGSHKQVTVIAASNYSALTDVYGAASGKVSTTISGAKCYQLLEASSGDGAQVKAICIGLEA